MRPRLYRASSASQHRRCHVLAEVQVVAQDQYFPIRPRQFGQGGHQAETEVRTLQFGRLMLDCGGCREHLPLRPSPLMPAGCPRQTAIEPGPEADIGPFSWQGAEGNNERLLHCVLRSRPIGQQSERGAQRTSLMLAIKLRVDLLSFSVHRYLHIECGQAPIWFPVRQFAITDAGVTDVDVYPVYAEVSEVLFVAERVQRCQRDCPAAW